MSLEGHGLNIKKYHFVRGKCDGLLECLWIGDESFLVKQRICLHGILDKSFEYLDTDTRCHIVYMNDSLVVSVAAYTVSTQYEKYVTRSLPDKEFYIHISSLIFCIKNASFCDIYGMLSDNWALCHLALVCIKVPSLLSAAKYHTLYKFSCFPKYLLNKSSNFDSLLQLFLIYLLVLWILV